MYKDKVSLVGLRQCLQGYDQGLRNGHCSYSYGNWKIGDGAYDLAWTLYYKGNPCVECVQGSYEQNGFIENVSFRVDDFVRVFSTVMNEYGNIKLHPDTLAEYPDLTAKLDLSQVLDENAQWDWEKQNNISIEDDKVIQKIAHELKRRDIVLERNSDEPTTYDLGVDLGEGIGVEWFSLSTDGTLKGFENALHDTAVSFDPADFYTELVRRSNHMNEDKALDYSLAASNLQFNLRFSFDKSKKIIRKHSKEAVR